MLLGRTENGLYQIGNPSGRLAYSYSCNQLSIAMSQILVLLCLNFYQLIIQLYRAKTNIRNVTD